MMGDRFYLKNLQEGNAFAQLLRKIVLFLKNEDTAKIHFIFPYSVRVSS
jgi:hypothetical protein